jgi:signal transduction histidine kinase
MADKDELLSVARRLFGAQTERDVYEVAVRSLFGLTDADECALAVSEDGELVSRASVTPGLIDAPEGPLADEFGLIERAYRKDETLVVADPIDGPWDWEFHDPNPDISPVSEGTVPYRSLLCTPLEPGGILVATADRPGEFDRETRQTAEGIRSLVEDALERLPTEPETATADPDNLETAVSTLTHEMMDKLMIANNQLEAARENPKPEHFDRVADVHNRIETFVEDMAQYLRTGERIPEPKRVDIGAVAERAWQLVETPGIELESPDHLDIVADEGMITDLFENLFRNCAEHGFGDDKPKPGSRRVVRVGRLGAGKGFYVEDNGRGIDPDYSESVFESGVTTAADGSGLGLSICEDVATAHGWDIDTAEGDDGGARFEVTGVEFVGGNRERPCEPMAASELGS